MQQLEAAQGDWYTRLVTPLSEQDKKSLQEVFTLANQRKNARDSKNIEQAGGKYFNASLIVVITITYGTNIIWTRSGLILQIILFENLFFLSGYQFSNQTVPGQFNFASNAGHNFSFGN